jgi:hypothetical protein
MLGQDRANQILDLAKMAPLSNRYIPTSALASLLVGTADLGPEWWMRNHEELSEAREWEPRGTPDALLNAGHSDPEIEDGGSCLAELAGWIADDAANKAWGKPIDYLDIDGVDGRAVLPDDARAGDRLTAIVSPGVRIWVDVIEREGKVGPGQSRLDSHPAEHRTHEVAEVRSAWSIAVALGPIRLPGETPGRPSDPFSDHLDHDASRRLFSWALANGVSKADLAGPWRTKDALWTARFRFGLPYSRPGSWFIFDDAVAAAIDGDRDVLMDALARLEG